MPDTHIVTNQVPPLENYNPATSPVLIEALIREGGQWGLDEVTELGALSGSQQAQRWGELADRHRPVLRTHDRYGHRIDEVEYDPAYHELMRVAVGHGLHAAPWADDRPGSHVVRAAKTSVWTPEPGHICPISMTYAVIPALRFNPELAATYEPLLASREYDPELKVPAAKAGITAGMSMTEKQGGSDVRAGTTQATPNANGTYSLTGHKWFTSAPMCDVFLVLAQAPSGLSCFFLPRILPDGTRNRMFLQRLKDKLGNHANASSEVEYDGATAWLVGEEGRGVPTIIEMVNLTRLDCTLGSATSMRTGLTRAIHHAQHRKAFGAYLIDQPLMRNVLADLAVEAEAATVVAMRMAGATDNAVRGDETRVTVPPDRPRRQQVLGVQARHPARGGGDGVPGRQRLRGGVGHAAAVPRGAADGHLGGFRQRQRAGHVARHGNSARKHRSDVRRTRQERGTGPAPGCACGRAAPPAR